MPSKEKAIWFGEMPSLDRLNALSRQTLAEHLCISFTAIGNDFLCATMPVGHRTHQPYGLLHGGASVALAETVGSMASAMVIDSSQCKCVGVEVNANHIRSIQAGTVTATARPLHLGKSTHVWDIRICTEGEENQLICVARLTVAILRDL